MEKTRLEKLTGTERTMAKVWPGYDIPTFGHGGVVGGTPVKLRNKEMLVGNNAQAVSSEKMGATQPTHTNGAVPLKPGTAIISPANVRKAKLIAASQKPEVEKLNKVLQNPNASTLAKKTAQRRLQALKSSYDPLIAADAANAPDNDTDRDGTPTAGGGGLVTALGLSNPYTAALSALPMLYNIGQGLFGDSQKLDPNKFHNPYESGAMSLMANRRFNINPTLEANQSAAAAGNYNLRQSGINQGAYAANQLGLQNARMRGDAQAYATKQNADNQYKGEQSQQMAQLGAQRAQTDLMVQDLNDRNKSAKTQMLSAGLGQLGQFGQVNQQMFNQQSRDKMLMGSFRSWMDAMTGAQGAPKSANTYGLSAPTLGSRPNNTLASSYGRMPNNNFPGSVDPNSLQLDSMPYDTNTMAPPTYNRVR